MLEQVDGYQDNIFPEILISKMGVKMNLTIKTKKYVADPEIEFITKSV